MHGTIRIWGRANAFNVQKAMWVLGETGVPFERIDVGGSFGGLDDAAFRSMNPNGRIPVIDDDGVIVWESNAIVRYLAARYAAGTMWPQSPAERSFADRWMDWYQNHLHRDFMDLFWGLVRQPERERNWPRINTLIAQCADRFMFLDAHLANNRYLGGETFTIGDVPAGTTLYRYFEMDIERPDIPNVERWYRDLLARPAYAAHVAMPFTDLIGRKDY